MTTVFRSYLPRFNSNTYASISNEQYSCRTNSIVSLHDEQLNENTMDSSLMNTQQNLLQSKPTTICSLHSSSHNEFFTNEIIEENQSQHIDSLSEPKQLKISRLKNKPTKRTKKRGPCYSRMNKNSQPLLTRLVDTIFGESQYYDENQTKKKRISQPSKKLILPSNSTIQKQFEDNEKTLRSLVTLLTQIESNVKVTNNHIPSTSNDLSIEQARNNNRMDDTSISHSNDTYEHKSKAKSKRYTNYRSTKKNHLNKRKQSEDDTLSTSSITTTHYSSQSSLINQRKMIDNQQQTQIYPTKINIATSTQFNQVNDAIASEPSWLDVMREDQTTNDAWARIRRRLKPNQQKDILRALMIICANLFEVPIENKHI
ncbi:hypothetical protein I4U23_009011 [Adineta vaga]|nr:hypothetical protein I4U23_009011 [Adineta vaga]